MNLASFMTGVICCGVITYSKSGKEVLFGKLDYDKRNELFSLSRRKQTLEYYLENPEKNPMNFPNPTEEEIKKSPILQLVAIDTIPDKVKREMDANAERFVNDILGPLRSF